MTVGDDARLNGLRLFLVEDEALIAMLLETMLGSLGCVVVDIAGSVAQALDRLDQVVADVDAAILDVNLGQERVYPVADELAKRGKPFLFATGYGPASIGDRYPGRLVLTKPYGREVLARSLIEICNGRAS